MIKEPVEFNSNFYSIEKVKKVKIKIFHQIKSITCSEGNEHILVTFSVNPTPVESWTS